jgi:hypothetical protein
MPIGAKCTIIERERRVTDSIFILLIHLFLSDKMMDMMDSQILDGGPPKRFIDSPIHCWEPIVRWTSLHLEHPSRQFHFDRQCSGSPQIHVWHAIHHVPGHYLARDVLEDLVCVTGLCIFSKHIPQSSRSTINDCICESVDSIRSFYRNTGTKWTNLRIWLVPWPDTDHFGQRNCGVKQRTFTWRRGEAEE